MGGKKRKNPDDRPGNRIKFLIGFMVFLATAIIARLFYLQVIKHDFYEQVAAKEHFGYLELPARRGEIFIKDYASKELVRVATNTILDLLYADPTLIENKKLLVERIAPIIFDPEEAKKQDRERIKTEIAKAKTTADQSKIKALTDEELFKQFSEDLLEKISQNVRQKILLSNELGKDTLAGINNLHLAGIETTEKELLAYPVQITDRANTALALAPFLELSPLELENILKGLNRYVVLKRKLNTTTSVKIKELIAQDKNKIFLGLGLKEEYYRYYPEKTLASNILGFVTATGIGQYGIESKFNTQLQGKKGVFQTQKDSIGRQITVGDSIIQPAVDGQDIILTIDRSIQMTVEKKLAKAVADYRADNGQVIVLEPKTGRIIAMANYPTFDPNSYSSVFEKDPIHLKPEEIAALVPIQNEENTFWFYRNILTLDRIKIFKETLADGTVIYKKYKNTFGAEAYQNKVVAQNYEPGSIFKIVTMASALDDGDVKPSTSFTDPGFLQLDWNPSTKKYDYEIRNVSTKCTGRVNMAWVIQNSCNTGIAQVAQKMGRNLFYNYILKFGFNERTEIEFDNESSGKIGPFEKWTDSELATHAFGQGITVTPLQMVAAYSVIANKGVLMQPHIVESINQKNKKTVPTDQTSVQRVVSEQTANLVTAMLVNNVENGDSYGRMRLPRHYFGAKTGTAQTYRGGKALSGVGTTITTVLGFAPIDNPKFVILAKLDHPRTVEWADATAGVLLHDIMEYLFDYYSIPPDKK